MLQYLLSVYGNEEKYAAVAPEDQQRMYEQVSAFNDDVQSAGAFVFGGGLQLASTATVVMANDVESTMTAGPYLETNEHIGGFWIITAPDLDAALAWAAKASAACMSEVEVRPFQDESGEADASS